ncbi:MAG: hypothetical protein UW98_C0048G0005 [Parcubacteria group bacterium GW2011_GWC2_45_15]|nr:MAG: hypothetical protein UW98_C0048G0005 [Parcubacteria group bacterium GW2011_GWC2_45_15]
MKSNIFKFFLVSFLILILTGCASLTMMSTKNLTINGSKLTVEVAETWSQLSQGLGGRTELGADQGMLFVYADSHFRNFHMKEMNFPLDFIWINERRIVGLSANVPVFSADGTISRLKSPGPVNRVLEIPAGWIAAHGLKIGDTVAGLD